MRSFLLLLALAGLCPAQTVSLPKEVTGKVGEWIIVPVLEKDGGTVQWYSPDGLNEVPLTALFGDDWAERARGRVFKAERDGRYRVCAYVGKADKASQISVCVVVIGQSPEPPPTPPQPPGPTPPQPPPAPAKQLRSLVIYETAELSKLPASQIPVLYGAEVRTYLDSHCPKPDGKTADFRFWDKDVTSHPAYEKVDPHWKAAMARPRTTLPWLILMDGERFVFEGPLPVTVAETMTLLKTYGG
jgi:hypothetical protein